MELAPLALLLQSWLTGYRLPSIESPLFEVEEANLGILRYFLAVLAVSAGLPQGDPLTVLRQHIIDCPDFPREGYPSSALQSLGVARPQGPLVELQDRLLQSFTGEQRAMVVILSGA